jgi:NAD(P)-dependent dehydrogenase (short-subunit alcohol dehydrogenase family)
VRAEDVRGALAALGVDAYVTDVRDSAQVDAFMGEVARRYGALDVLINNVGDFLYIVNIFTIEAFRGIPHAALYSAFKAGIAGFTKSLAPRRVSGPRRRW